MSERPGAPAVVARSGTVTYRQLDDLATRSAGALRALGVRGGDRVACSLPNDIMIVAAFHGAMRLGAIWVGVNQQLAPPEKAFVLDDAGASLLLTDPATVEQLEAYAAGRRTKTLPRLVATGLGSEESGAAEEWDALLAEAHEVAPATPDPLAPAAIAYTSGTSGAPKGAVHSQHNLMLPGAVLVQTRGYGPHLRKADCFPLTILNLQVLSTLLVAQAKGTAILMDRVDPVGIAEWIARERPTVFNGAPAMLYGLATDDGVEPEALESLEDVWSGGSGCSPQTRELFTAKFGRPVHQTYGLTEAPSVVTIVPQEDIAHARTSGRPLPHLRVAITGDDGRETEPGTIGEITVDAVSSGEWAGAYRPMLGYWRPTGAGRPVVPDPASRPGERAEPGGRGGGVHMGVLHTGDLGHLDDDGFLVVEERQSSVILRGGANVYPAEVERVLDAAPGVAASCVVGIPDERLGERVAAVVEPSRPGVDPATLHSHCRAHLARYKVPEILLLGRLPRNSMGKVMRGQVARTLSTSRVAPPVRDQARARHDGEGQR